MTNSIFIKHLSLVIFFVFSLKAYSQINDIGPGNGVDFKDNNSWIEIENAPSNFNLPVSAMAWVKVGEIQGAWSGLYKSHDSPNLYAGFWFLVSPDRINIGYGDGKGANDPVFRRSKIADIVNIKDQWVHIAMVMRVATNMDIYLNGVNVGGFYTGSSNFPMETDVSLNSKIGFENRNNIQYPFNGEIDELRVWDIALTQEEVRQQMCSKIPLHQEHMLGWWSFDEESGNTTFDKSSHERNGTLTGDIQRMLSGAALGDESKYIYTNNWDAVTLDFDYADDFFEVSNINSPNGIHIYANHHSPPNVDFDNFSVDAINKYFGVYSAFANNNQRNYDVHIGPTCEDEVGVREDNASDWELEIGEVFDQIVLISDNEFRGEYFQLSAFFNFPILPELFLCDGEEILFSIDHEGIIEVIWNNGPAGNSILITQPGVYPVVMKSDCTTKEDTLIVKLNEASFFTFPILPELFICDGEETLFSIDHEGITEVIWNNGPAGNSIQFTHPGEYPVVMKSECLTKEDTLIVVRINEPYFELIPSEDQFICFDDTIKIVATADEFNFHLIWKNDTTYNGQTEFIAMAPDTYVAVAENECGIYESEIELDRSPDPVFFIPNVITPNGDGKNDYFELSQELLGSELKVFNRWGRMVFHSINYENNWSPDNLATGVYFYNLIDNCTKRSIKGPLHIKY